MAALTETFSESWHRLAGRRLSLRAGVRAQRQHFRGERWHVLFDPFSNQFFRVRGGAWDFLARLGDGRTVQQCWDEALAQSPSEAPGQEEVIQLLAQLYQANLLTSDLPPDAAQLLSRHRKRRQREARTRWLSLLFIKIPLVNPDAFLVRTLPLVRWLMGWAGLVLWLAAVGLGLKTGVENWGALWDQGQSILAPGNLAWLYVAMVGLKLLHEFGHAYACRHFGGPVPTLGVMLLIFSPLPFVDATAAWGFRERWKRVVVGAAGMIVEVFVAAVAVVVWASTGPGALNAVAYNMIFIASVSTLLANANPLLRFDGYYILCDLIDLPNLNQRAQRMWRHLIERYGFGWRKSVTPAESRREAGWLAVYGAASFVYRIVLFAGILWFVAGQWLLLGVLMAVIGLITMVLVPLGKLINYLVSSPRIERVRRRAVAVTLGGMGGILLLLGVVPVPDAFTAPGIVQAQSYAVVHAGADGAFAELVAPSGRAVRSGDVVIRVANEELAAEVRAARAEVDEVLALERSALDNPGEGVAAIRERLQAVRQRLAELDRLQSDLEIRAPVDGTWVTPERGDFAGRWIARGTAVGEVVDESSFRFAAVVRQEDASNLFGPAVRPAGVRLHGQAGERLTVRSLTVMAAPQNQLPSAALGWQGGGEIAVKADDSSGTRAAESFFEVRAELESAGTGVVLRHGRSGELRCQLPWRPLMGQWWRLGRQLVQKRFQL
ncbi:MAG: peptidase M50 [Verrucomicrobiales bacterium]